MHRSASLWPKRSIRLTPPDTGDNSGIYDQPPQGYTTLDDTYAKIAEETAWPEGHSASGEPLDPEAPTTNTEGGGLPMFSKEPYPTGNPPTRSYGKIREGKPQWPLPPTA